MRKDNVLSLSFVINLYYCLYEVVCLVEKVCWEKYNLEGILYGICDVVKLKFCVKRLDD